MNVAIFYDEKKKDAAMAIKNIIISHECDVTLYNEDEIWKDENLHTPRRATPRTVVPAGSVGIGGAQTGIYPFSSPGGWQLIGYTKQALFDKNQAQPTLLQAGDTVKFIVDGIEL